MYSITRLASAFALSRSTLLYYHRIGLLAPSARTRSNYRQYSETDRERLESICLYRRAGLSLEDIQTLLSAAHDQTAEILQRRLHTLATELQACQAQQRLVAEMLQVKARGWQNPTVDKTLWVTMLRAAGMSEAAMDAWHREFELRAPEAHLAFLLSLGISLEEVELIRAASRRPA
jgi:MerR family transcriptional regulator, thiopeptide resistance regulator